MAHTTMKQLYVDPNLHQRIKITAPVQGKTIQQFVADALEAALPAAYKKKGVAK